MQHINLSTIILSVIPVVSVKPPIKVTTIESCQQRSSSIFTYTQHTHTVENHAPLKENNLEFFIIICKGQNGCSLRHINLEVIFTAGSYIYTVSLIL